MIDSLFRQVYNRTWIHRKVIDEVGSQSLREAYRHCRAITRFHARTFYLSSRLLPRNKQRAIFAIYGLCRYLDDLVDEAMDLMQMQKIGMEEVEQRLGQFRRDLIHAYGSGEGRDLILTAFADTLRQFHISIRLPLELLEGVKLDLVKSRYRNFEELYNYSWKVASVVGLMTSEVFGYQDKRALKHAADLGIAMQLTNILRDVGEDLEKDRIYLPLDELELFGVTEQQLFEGHIDKNFVQLMRLQILRARQYYESADVGIAYLNPDSRLPVRLARENYSRILNKIEENGYRVFDRRAYLNRREKLLMVPKLLISR